MPAFRAETQRLVPYPASAFYDAFEKIASSYDVQLSGLPASNLASGTPPSQYNALSLKAKDATLRHNLRSSASSRELRRWSRTRSPTELDLPTPSDIPPPRIPPSSLSTILVPAPSVALAQGPKCSSSSWGSRWR
ncbi:hypothetical protein EXIGLDRAFT_265364 [Exidia glandulosa HHB12029]|uniref:Uncharacterized protein n=1 Tax=Exidia glandulosa HHB12029 TaxID=1314781 RepID=A0A165DPW0_EXIGL|nr:hypothetical protein EXIGLDRAFT_265364 [Exidia glandulosa HHB12029]